VSAPELYERYVPSIRHARVPFIVDDRRLRMRFHVEENVDEAALAVCRAERQYAQPSVSS
jgi:hypothetical protein